jgi:hypothetical protein
MSLNKFLNNFEITSDAGNHDVPTSLRDIDADFVSIIKILGGKTFNGGLYRVLRADQVSEITKSAEQVFPEFSGRIVVFGYDWLGRYFAIDLKQLEGEKPQILMLETGVGEVMNIPVSILDFHNVEMVDHMNDALSSNFYEKWKKENPLPIPFDKCIGYKIPLFLGGADEILNLEVIDLSVYSEICGQLRSKIVKLAPGQTIAQVSMQD